MSRKNKSLPEKKPSTISMYSGIVGALIFVLCCLTPLAVLVLSMAGLGYLTGYIDVLAWSVLIASLGFIGYGCFRKTYNGDIRNVN